MLDASATGNAEGSGALPKILFSFSCECRNPAKSGIQISGQAWSGELMKVPSHPWRRFRRLESAFPRRAFLCFNYFFGFFRRGLGQIFEIPDRVLMRCRHLRFSQSSHFRLDFSDFRKVTVGDLQHFFRIGLISALPIGK